VAAAAVAVDFAIAAKRKRAPAPSSAPTPQPPTARVAGDVGDDESCTRAMVSGTDENQGVLTRVDGA